MLRIAICFCMAFCSIGCSTKKELPPSCKVLSPSETEFAHKLDSKWQGPFCSYSPKKREKVMNMAKTMSPDQAMEKMQMSPPPSKSGHSCNH